MLRENQGKETEFSSWKNFTSGHVQKLEVSTPKEQFTLWGNLRSEDPLKYLNEILPNYPMNPNALLDYSGTSGSKHLMSFDSSEGDSSDLNYIYTNPSPKQYKKKPETVENQPIAEESDLPDLEL